MIAKTVKVTDQGKTVILPISVIGQARDMALAVVAFDKKCTSARIISESEKYSKDVEKAFHAYLNGYAESMIPAANPGRHRAQAAVRVFDQLMDGDKGFYKKRFPNETAEKRQQRSLLLKSACLQIVDGMLEASGIDKKSVNLNDDEISNKDIIGMNFTDGIKGKDKAAVIAFNRYYMYTLMTWVLSLVTKMYELEDSEIRPLIMQKLKDKTFGELNQKDTSSQFTNEIKNRVLRMLDEIHLPNSLK